MLDIFYKKKLGHAVPNGGNAEELFSEPGNASLLERGAFFNATDENNVRQQTNIDEVLAK